MGGETERNVSSWTVDTLLQLVNERDIRYEQRFNAQQKAIQDALLAAEKAVAAALIEAEKAVSKAEVATEKRFESMNEFRGQLSDQAATMVMRTEFLAKFDGLTTRIADLTARIDRRDGTGTGRKDMWGWAIGGIGLLIAVAAFFLKLH